MSEVDRLSNSGLYPLLPVADQRSSKEDAERRRGDTKQPRAPVGDTAETGSHPRPPKSLIDEYA